MGLQRQVVLIAIFLSELKRVQDLRDSVMHVGLAWFGGVMISDIRYLYKIQGQMFKLKLT